jgi:hypothetical protein
VVGWAEEAGGDTTSLLALHAQYSAEPLPLNAALVARLLSWLPLVEGEDDSSRRC